MALCYFHFFISETVAIIDLQKAHFLKPLFGVACIINFSIISLLHENDNERFSKFFDIVETPYSVKGASVQGGETGEQL